MKFYFAETEPQKVVDAIMAQLGGRELGKMVRVDIEDSGLNVTISKFGTSNLRFSRAKKDEGLEFSLVDEKIAFTHRAFKDDVTKKLCSVIEQAGGKVS